MITKENKKKASRGRFWFECAQLVIALFVPLTIVTYTVIQNNTEISIAKENRFQDLKIADERYEQDILLSNDKQEEATLVRYFDSLGKLLEKNEKLVNQTNIVRFQTLTALAQLKSKRKAYLIRSLIENNLIIRNNSRNSILDLSLADLTGLDLTNNMLVNNKIKCADLSYTTLTNSSFQGMGLDGSTFIHTTLINSDFSSTSTFPWWCGDGNIFGVNFNQAILDDSIFDDANYEKSSFSRASLNRVRMHRFKCSECIFIKAQMNSMDLSGAKFVAHSRQKSNFQLVNMSSTLLHKTNFTGIDFSTAELMMINATETIFVNSNFEFTSLQNSSFIQTVIINSSFHHSLLIGSSWNKAKVNSTDFTRADMTYVNFTNSECHYCLFNQTKLTGTNFTNSSLHGSDFRQANVTYEQLIAARSLHNVILPNGTIIQSMKNKYP